MDLTSQHHHYLLVDGKDEEFSPSAVEMRKFQSTGTLGRTLELRKAVADIRPDFVHLHSSWAGAYGRLTRLEAKIIYQPHCYKFDDANLEPPKRWLFKLAEKLLSFRSSATVVLSPHEEKLTLGLNSNLKCFYVPNVPSCDSVKTEILPASYSSDPKRVVMVGRVCTQKDPIFFGEVARLAALRPTLRDWVFRWVGDGEPELKSGLESQGVQVSGWKSGADLVAELDGADYYVHSASYEGFPISILDAAARGVPVIARRIDALTGSEAYQVTTPLDVVDALERAEMQFAFRMELSERSAKLLDAMNEDKQEKAWLDLYSGARTLIA
jgi:glycosyltransferase involved in cell wall biosynthesis